MKNERTNRLFRAVYATNLALILLIAIVGVLQGLLEAYLYAVYLVTPLAAIFIVPNAWEIARFEGKRLYFALTIAILVIWCVWGFSAWNETPFP